MHQLNYQASRQSSRRDGFHQHLHAYTLYLIGGVVWEADMTDAQFARLLVEA